MRLFILGGTGNSGKRLLTLALARGHSVTALVRNATKLRAQFAEPPPPLLTILEGGLDDEAALAAQMAGHDVVINAAGNIGDGPSFPRLVQVVIHAAGKAMDPGGRFWLFGGAGALDVPGSDLLTLDLPLIPKVFEAHRANFREVSASPLDWSMLCPGPIMPAANGQAHVGLRTSVDTWPCDPPSAINRVLPRIAQSIAFIRRVPQLTITYEDVATVILDHLEANGPFSRKRVGVALPIGMSARKPR
jgi:uncharacterized protein